MGRQTCVPVVATGAAVHTGWGQDTRGRVGMQMGRDRGWGDLFTGRPVKNQAKMRETHVLIDAWNPRSVWSNIRGGVGGHRVPSSSRRGKTKGKRGQIAWHNLAPISHGLT